MLVFPQMDPTKFSLENSTEGGPRHSKWKQQFSSREEENSNTSHGGPKDLQKAPPLAA